MELRRAGVPLPEAVTGTVAELARRLRSGGLGVSTSEVLDATRVLAAVDQSRRDSVYVALKSALVKDLSHDVLFRRSFDAVFPALRRSRPEADGAEAVGGGLSDDDALDDVVRALRDGEEDRLDLALDEALNRFSRDRGGDGRTAGQHTRQVLRRMDIGRLYRRYLEGAGGDTEFERAVERAEARAALEQMERRIEDLMAGRIRETTGVDFQAKEDLEDRSLLKAGPDELLAMRQAIRPLVRRLAARLGNKRRRGTASLDMRRT
ncbi:MAG TPA: hypothetical protein VFA92_02815, partial [Candidatus Binatia bacterium]|nr:hypothetical protein [Candidatus Binatia bacterium]